MQIIAFTLPEPGVHIATVVAVEDQGEQVSSYNRNKKYHPIKLVFELKDGRTQWMWANATLGYRSTLRPIVEALLGSVPAVFETADLIGRDCEIQIEQYEEKGQLHSKVTEVRPLTKLSA